MVFITGGTGLLGSHLLLELLLRGSAVRALCREDSDLDRIRRLHLSLHPEAGALWDRIQWVQGELTDLPAMERALDGVTEVWHCAAMVSFDPRDREALLRINAEGTQTLVNACLAGQVQRFCHVSSIATVDGNGGMLDESDSWDPARSGVYATSKYLAEMEAWRAAQEGLHVLIVNPGVILGPGFWETGSGKFFTRVAGGLRHYPPGGTGFIGAGDTARIMLRLMDGGYTGERFILVSENLSYRELLEKIASRLRVEAPRKALKIWQLELLRRLDALRSALFGAERLLTKSIVHSLRSRSYYSNGKLRSALGQDPEPIDQVLDRCAVHFLKRQANG